MRLNTDGLVIREQNISENDRLVTVLTRDCGVIRAFVRGAQRIKSSLLSSTQLLCYSRMSIYKGRDKYIIDEAQPVEVFFGLRSDIEKLSLAQYFAELSSQLAPQEEQAESFLRIMLNTLHLLAEGKKPPLQLKAIFELRTLSISGYMPDLLACRSCGSFESDVMYFSLGEGCIYCQNCRPDEAGIWEISRGVVTAMRHIIYSDMPKLYSFTLPEKGLKVLSDITEQYMLLHIQRGFKTLDFYHSVETKETPINSEQAQGPQSD